MTQKSKTTRINNFQRSLTISDDLDNNFSNKNKRYRGRSNSYLEAITSSERARNIDNKISVFAKNTSSLRNLLNTSKGRDKFSQLLQYIANLYITCMKNSDFAVIAKKGEIPNFNRLKLFESQISNGRKIFRLFLWLNEIEVMRDILHSAKLTFNLKILKMISCICSFIYYFTDNIVWLSKIGFTDRFVPFSKRILGYPLKWGKIKDKFSLGKSILELVIYTYTYVLK